MVLPGRPPLLIIGFPLPLLRSSPPNLVPLHLQGAHPLIHPQPGRANSRFLGSPLHYHQLLRLYLALIETKQTLSTEHSDKLSPSCPYATIVYLLIHRFTYKHKNVSASGHALSDAGSQSHGGKRRHFQMLWLGLRAQVKTRVNPRSRTGLFIASEYIEKRDLMLPVFSSILASILALNLRASSVVGSGTL